MTTLASFVAGVAVLLVGLFVRAFGLEAVVWAETLWVRLYTRGLPVQVRDRRRMEIASDVFEQRQHDASEAYTPELIAARLLIRWLLGVPSDLSWRIVQHTDNAAMDFTLPSVGYALKRPFSVSMALLALMALSPIVLGIAFFVWLEDRGPVFVRERRIGMSGMPFWLVKFRANPRTKIGRVLQTTTLYAVPVLLNVVKGDMDLVGPRPMSPFLACGSRFHNIDIVDVPNYHVRTLVRPGLTGLAQVYAPADIEPDRQFKYDALYTRRTSLWLDIRLLAISLIITIAQRWKRRGRWTGQSSDQPNTNVHR